MPTDEMGLVEKIARLAHNINRAFQEVIGETLSPEWKDFTGKDGVKEGVGSVIRGEINNAKEMHDLWMKSKIADGWVYGEVKDFDKKTHPCLVEYDSLSINDKIKDYLFMASVKEAMKFELTE